MIKQHHVIFVIALLVVVVFVLALANPVETYMRITSLFSGMK